MSDPARRKISVARICVFGAILLISILTAWLFGTDLQQAEKASEYIGVVFSILAASLLAVVSILSSPNMIVSPTARHAWEAAKEVQREIFQFNFLFFWYLLTLGLLVISEIVNKSKWEKFYCLNHVFLFFATSGFLVSFFVPGEFARIQQRRLEQEISSRSKPPRNEEP